MDREMSVIEKADAKWRVIAVAPLPGDDECRPDCKKLPTTAEKKRVLASDDPKHRVPDFHAGSFFKPKASDVRQPDTPK